MTLDFPLILVILVFGTGLVWAFDAVFSAPGRRLALDELRVQFPNWEQAQGSQAQKYQAGAERVCAEPIAVEYAKSFFPVLFVVFVLRSFLVEPFQIPSSSMVPTLQVGDYILVNKFTYGIRLPVIRNKVFAINEPKRGDVMVFFPPHMNDTYYIKRVIGLPGDRISYRDKKLTINGEALPQEYLATLPDGKAKYTVGLEELGGSSHLMQTSDLRPARDYSVLVQPGHYFMMGDNRDNSSDSRVWGQVPEKDIVGKAFAVWMHWESLASIPSFSRVGSIQ